MRTVFLTIENLGRHRAMSNKSFAENEKIEKCVENEDNPTNQLRPKTVLAAIRRMI